VSISPALYIDLKFTLHVILRWSGTGGLAPEAPHMYKKGDKYYLIVAEGAWSAVTGIVRS
jgi:beta-xylosidase